MKIQIIDYSEEKQENGFVYSSFATPRSLDEFDINIIDLSEQSIWEYDGSQKNVVNCKDDFQNIKKMLQNSTIAKNIIVLPQDGDFHYYKNSSNSYRNRTRLKNMLPELYQEILPRVIPSYAIPLAYENTTTSIYSKHYSASFYFERFGPVLASVLTFSDYSKKPTTLKMGTGQYITTLDITISPEHIHNYLITLFPMETPESKPAWLDEIVFSDDLEQRARIEQKNIEIELAKRTIDSATAKLSENDRYKSILYSNGDFLVSVVFDILGQMLNYDLSDFIDKKVEDFRITQPTYTLIGEIKGISSNVKNENVSQLEIHYQSYMDELAEENRDENVYQLLIINPLRNKPLSERESIHERQIKLAERNGSLIIETKTLLKMFERFLQGLLSRADCERLFTTKTGLLKEEELTCIADQDMSQYMV